jgi:hypothetical protein
MGFKFEKMREFNLEKGDRVLIKTGEYSGRYGQVLSIEMDWLIGYDGCKDIPYWVNVAVDNGPEIQARVK